MLYEVITRYHDVRGVLSPPIEFTVPFFVYLKIVLHSGFKALFTRGGVFEHSYNFV